MKKIDLGQMIGILANVGVVAGIVFLGIELGQNNRLLEAQARSEREEVRRSFYSRYIENPDLITVTIKSQNGQPLTEEELFLLERANQWTLSDWRYIYNEVSEGLLDESALGVTGWRRNLRDRPGLSSLWDEAKPNQNPDFVKWMEDNIE